MHIVVSREDYFAAAYAVLADDGVAKLKIGTLCRALNVTSGSFYGYFGSLQGFIDAFLQDWEATQIRRITAQPRIDGDDRARLRGLKLFIDQLPHETESALRGWAHINPAVAVVQERVDARRTAVLLEHFAPIVGPERARTLAVAGMAMLIGVQQWRRPVDTAYSDSLFTEFERLVLTSVGAEDEEIQCNTNYITDPSGSAETPVGGER